MRERVGYMTASSATVSRSSLKERVVKIMASSATVSRYPKRERVGTTAGIKEDQRLQWPVSQLTPALHLGKG